MPGWNGSGDFSFTYNWVNDAANGVPITASRMDTQFNDAISGFENCITRDNQGKPSATILPDTTSAYDLGSSSYNWRAGYFSGALSVGGAATIGGSITAPSLLAQGSGGTGGSFTAQDFGLTSILTFDGIRTTVGNAGSPGGFVIINTTGGVTLASGSTSWGTVSDESAKLFFDPIPVHGALARVAGWRAGTYRYKWDTEETPRRVGLIAQDVARDRPEAVSMDKDGLLNLRLAEVIPDLVTALVEAKARIEALEAR